ncbi:MAG TPA: hypothetical protein VMF50_04630 [Candidatus Binataceae bacterium]|nr:hypothetical protein [Candidatus Binataceae bacterium]
MKERGPFRLTGKFTNIQFREAEQAKARLTALAAPNFDEFLVLEFYGFQ